jgi:hypothetical protein|tara:strand:- start:7859 stop:8545 length:687 start_codon:yes stop_codon:yes gene_type:complete
MLGIFSLMNRRWLTNPKFLIGLVCINALLATTAIIFGNGSSIILRIIATSIILVLATINHYIGTSTWSNAGLRIWGFMAVVGSAGIELYLLCLIWGLDQISFIPEKVAVNLAITSILGLIVSSVFLARPSKLVVRVTVSVCTALFLISFSAVWEIFNFPGQLAASLVIVLCAALLIVIIQSKYFYRAPVAVDILFCPYCGTSSPANDRSHNRCSSCENTFIVRKTSSN